MLVFFGFRKVIVLWFGGEGGFESMRMFFLRFRILFLFFGFSGDRYFRVSFGFIIGYLKGGDYVNLW